MQGEVTELLGCRLPIGFNVLIPFLDLDAVEVAAARLRFVVLLRRPRPVTGRSGAPARRAGRLAGRLGRRGGRRRA